MAAMSVFEVVEDQAKKKKTIPNVVLGIVLGICCILAVAPGLNRYCAFALIPCIAILFFYDEFYLLAAVFLFFSEQLTLAASITLFRAYNYLFLLRFVLFDLRKVKFKAWLFPGVAVMILYAVFALPNADVSVTVQLYIKQGLEPPSKLFINMKLILNYFLSIFYMLFLALKLYSDRSLAKRLFQLIPLFAVLAGIYGVRGGNTFLYMLGYDNNGEVTATRYNATFNDPNHASLYFNISIFAALLLYDFKKWYIKIPLLLALYYFLIAAGSMTGLAVQICGLAVFAVVKYRKKAIVMILAIAIGLGAAILTVMAVPKLRHLSVVQNLELRIQRQFLQNDSENADALTSGRVGQWQKYWGYFKEQSIPKKLFGGNIMTLVSIDPYFIEHFQYGPHQAYLGFLLNFGILGLLIFMTGFFIKITYLGLMALLYQDEVAGVLFMASVVWFLYGWGLDYFYNTTVMLFYFL